MCYITYLKAYLKNRPRKVLENLCGVLVRQDAQSEGLRAMAAVLMRTLFDVRSDLWFRVQPQTKSGGTYVRKDCFVSDTQPRTAQLKVTLTIGCEDLLNGSGDTRLERGRPTTIVFFAASDFILQMMYVVCGRTSCSTRLRDTFGASAW